MIKDDALQNKLNAKKQNLQPPPIPEIIQNEQKELSTEKLDNVAHGPYFDFFYNLLTIFFPCVQMFCYGYAVKVLFMPNINALGYISIGVAIYSILSKLSSFFNKN